MNVPLIVNASRKGITVIHNKKVERIDPPFEPYIIISKDGMKDPEFKATNFSDRREVPCKKMVIGEDAELGDIIYELRTQGYGVENNQYLEQIFIDLPGFATDYPNGPVDVLCFDIEVYTDGSGIFPHYDRSPIISIGAKYNDEKPVVFLNYLPNLSCPDKQIITEFLTYLKQKNPDIIVTYNGKSFDLPYLINRATKCGIDLKRFSRIKRDWLWKSTYGIPGHIHYDLYRVDVAKAQDLNGKVKNRKMKTVANYYDIPNIDLSRDEVSNTKKLIGTKRLADYNISDVEVSKALYDRYRLNHEFMAEFLNVSLEQAINAYPSFPPKIVLGREMKKLGFVFLDNNEARHPGLAGKYEGGYVSILKKGLIPKVWKLDVTGFYPSTMICFNISPETTTIKSAEPYSGVWDFKLENGVFRLRIPDKKLEKDIIIEIDQKKRGVLASMLENMRATRVAIKEQMKSADKTEKKLLKARTDALKVIMNSVYGSAALAETVYSDLSVALATISICRYLFTNVVEEFKEHIIEADSVSGDTPILVRTKDTDNYGVLSIKSIMELDGQEIEEPNDIKRKIPSIPLETLTKEGWADIVSIYSHKTQKEMFRVSDRGFTVDVTSDHSLINREGNMIKPTEIESKTRMFFTEQPELPQKENVISPGYAELLGFICSSGSPDLLKIDWDTANCNPEIQGPGRMYHMNEKSDDFRKRLIRLCYDSNGEKKVPNPVLEAAPKTVKKFLAKIRNEEGNYLCHNKTYAASVGMLLHKVDKSFRIEYDDNQNMILVEAASNLKKRPTPTVQSLGTSETTVYDITTSCGTFTNVLGMNELKNTDGIYVDKPLETEVVQGFIKKLVESMIGPTERNIEIEKDVFGPGWFHRAKNYVLFDPDLGEPVFHGVAFKSSSHSPIYDNIMNKVAIMIFAGQSRDEIWNTVEPLLDLDKYPLTDFILRTSIKGDEDQYSNENALQSRLIQQVKKQGLNLEPGTQIEYIVTKGKFYQIASNVQTIDEVDREYYKKDLMKALELFGLGDIQQFSLEL